MFNINGKATKKTLAIILASLFVSVSFTSCFDSKEKTDDGTLADEEIQLPENENKQEEIIINDNYASSELFDFEGTIDEIYEDGSMLVYSPSFGVNFNYMVIVEKDETTKLPAFEPKVNQQIKFNVYSAVKKSEPLTVVAYDMALVKEVSTQRAEEEARKQELQEKVDELLADQEKK